jgi:hypothetical protein
MTVSPKLSRDDAVEREAAAKEIFSQNQEGSARRFMRSQKNKIIFRPQECNGLNGLNGFHRLPWIATDFPPSRV